MIHDPVNHPVHYTSHPSGLECLDVTRLMGFDLGNAVKYVWRHEHKNGVEDLRKAEFYLTDCLRNAADSYLYVPRLALRLVAAAEIRDGLRHQFFSALADYDVRRALRVVEQMIAAADE